MSKCGRVIPHSRGMVAEGRRRAALAYEVLSYVDVVRPPTGKIPFRAMTDGSASAGVGGGELALALLNDLRDDGLDGTRFADRLGC